MATEVYKVTNVIAPIIMNEMFHLKDNIKYSSRFLFKTHNVNTVRTATETLTFLGPKIWTIVPNEVYVACVGFVDIQ